MSSESPQPTGEKTPEQPITLEQQINQIVLNARMEFATSAAQSTELVRSVFEKGLGQLAAMMLHQHQGMQVQQKLLFDAKATIERLQKKIADLESKSRR